MTEKAAVIGRKAFSRFGEMFGKTALFAGAGLVMSFGESLYSAAPGAFALAAGADRKNALAVIFGGALGAVLRGFPSALPPLSALIIAAAAKLIPDLGKPKLRAALGFISAGLACFFSRAANANNPAALLFVIISSVAAGCFALCVSLFENVIKTRGFDISEHYDKTLLGVISAGAFFSLGELDYTYFNVGRAALCILLLCTTARRGALFGAVLGLSSVFGLCAADPQMGAASACLAFSAAASCVFIKHGKITRAMGFFFFAAMGTLISGLDEGSWRIVIEAGAAAVAYIFIPIEKIKPSENDFSDATVSLIMRERLNFAADALAGVKTGLSAAAEALDRKYSFDIEGIGDRAADRVCRSCPNSMACWGRNYELFKKEFSRLVNQLRTGFELTEFSLSPECSEECLNPAGVARAITAEYSRYVSAMSDERRIRELRRVYSDQLSGMQEILRDISRNGVNLKPRGRNRAAEKLAARVLEDCGVEFPQTFVGFDKRGRMRVEAYGATGPRVERDYLGAILGKALGRELSVPEISGGGGRYRITALEAPALSVKLGVYQLPKGKNKVCGDCCESFTDASGAFYVILSDGMGTGTRARVDSAMACSVLSKLIKGGIPLSAALETVNTVLLVKSADESFATLDICRIDLSSGECAVYKAGAATTYIKSSDKLMRAALSSPPAGTGGKMSVPAQRFKVASGDIIIMTTDGAIIDEQWLSRELSRPAEPKELSERIAKAARAAENGARDDISVVAVSFC